MSTISIKRLHSADADFWPQLEQLLAWESVSDAAVAKTVEGILADVRQRGDAAVIDYTNRFDRLQVSGMGELEIAAGASARKPCSGIPAATRGALETAMQRLYAYHSIKSRKPGRYTEADGTLLGQQVTALDRVGLYVPGGKAAYPSSVLMNAMPGQGGGGARTDHGGAHARR